MPIPIRESDALRLASMITQLLSLRDGEPPAELEPDEIKLVVNHRRSRLLNDIENLGLQVKPDLPAPDVIQIRVERVEYAPEGVIEGLEVLSP